MDTISFFLGVFIALFGIAAISYLDNKQRHIV
jgi:hypothetical protein